MTRIKGWGKFQHFKDRRPPWIKLYRDILDDIEWFELSGDDAKTLIMLWLIASEHEGELPPPKTLSFRLRTTEKQINLIISRLSHWLEQDDISTISARYQSDAPETETETEKKETPDGFLLSEDKPKRMNGEAVEHDFDIWYEQYPNKKAKAAALKAYRKARKSVSAQILLDGLERYKELKEPWQNWAFPASWLNAGRWTDEGGDGETRPRTPAEEAIYQKIMRKTGVEA